MQESGVVYAWTNVVEKNTQNEEDSGGDLMQNNDSLKQQCLNQLIGQETPEGEALRQAASYNPQRNNGRGTIMTGAAHESAKICHFNNSANLLGDALC